MIFRLPAGGYRHFVMLILAGIVLSSCSGPLARRMVEAPNLNYHTIYPDYTSLPMSVGTALDAHQQALHIRRMPVESGAVSLRMLVIEPADAPFARSRDNQWRRAWQPTLREPVGTVVLLHGMWGSIDFLIDHGVAFANAGWRTVLVELPGHGESTGDTVTYGNRESRDVIEVLQRLQADGTLRPPVALIGWSLGGSVAILAAARGAPVDSVVAIAPFARLRDVAPNFADRFGGWLKWLATDSLTDAVIAKAGDLAGFDPLADSPLTAIPHVQQPLLLLHGADDTLIPPQQSELLAHAARAAGNRSVYRALIPGQDHIETVLNASLTVPEVLDWLRHTPTNRQASDAPLMLVGPLTNHPGEPETGISTWTWRAAPWDFTGPWPRPAGVRRLRLWPTIPLPWLYRDLTIDLGTMPRSDTTTYNGVTIGTTPYLQPWPGSQHRRYYIPGWLQTPNGELTIRMETAEAETGVSWAGGSAIMQPARSATP